MIDNSKYIGPEVIAYELSLSNKNKEWDLNTVRTWCMNCETRYIKDVDTMIEFEQIPLRYEHEQVLLPCNVFRILDVYRNHYEILDYKNNGAFLYDFKWKGIHRHYPEGTAIFINYRGINIDHETGECLIVKGHEEACKLYCKLQMYEDDRNMGRFPKDIYAQWEEQFSGMYMAARSNYQHKDRKKIDNLTIIRGNMVPKIGSLVLHNQQFNEFYHGPTSTNS
jgi:hypothetical protein